MIDIFNQQEAALLQKGYPAAAGMTQADFLAHCEPLRRHVEELSMAAPDYETGFLPFVLVVTSALIDVKQRMSLLSWRHEEGVMNLYPREPEDFEPIVEIPDSPIYLLMNIDRGSATRNLAPSEAKVVIQKENRQPLTMDEGIAIVTHYPDFLVKNNCFSMLASRFPEDKRVPAIWINGDKRANLGWCWDGNPHTWLGSASCQTRLGL